MNRQQQEARELIELEIKLARLKIASSYLKQRRLQEIKSRQAIENEQNLYKLVDLGSNFAASSTSLLQKTSHLPLPKVYRYAALVAVLALKAWQQQGKR